MKMFYAMVCCAVLCCASAHADDMNTQINDPEVKSDAPVDRNPIHSNIPLWHFCVDKLSGVVTISDKDWILSADAVFTGKVIERRLTHENLDKTPFNGCWVKFKVTELFKGSFGPEIWIKAYYSDLAQNDIYDYKNCYFQSGKYYFLTAQHIKPEGDRPEFLATQKDTLPIPRYACAPIEELPGQQETAFLKEVRRIFRKSNPQ